MTTVEKGWKEWGNHPIYITTIVLLTALSTCFAYLSWVGSQDKDVTDNSKCIAFQEEGGTVVIEADQYTIMLPGRESSLDKSNPNRDATAVSWQENPTFPGTLQVVPDIQNTNTLSDTNGPALVYLINFKKAGTYYVYIRGFGVDGNGDSVHVGLSGQAITTDFKNGFAIESGHQEPRWYWQTKENKIASIEVTTSGLYTFYVWARENGVNVQRIWLDINQNDTVQNGDKSEGPPLSPCIETM